MSYYVGIDGGGTKTECVVGDETRELGRGRGGSNNLHRVSEELVQQALAQAILQACQQAGIAPSQVEACCLGAAGAARPAVLIPMRRMLRELLPGCADRKSVV